MHTEKSDVDSQFLEIHQKDPSSFSKHPGTLKTTSRRERTSSKRLELSKLLVIISEASGRMYAVLRTQTLYLVISLLNEFL